MSEGTSGVLVSILMVASIVIIMVVGTFCIKDKVYQEIEKTGQIRIYDDLYKCEFVGKYVTEERFIPSTVTMEDLPKEIQDKLK